MTKRLTTEDFIMKATEIHGDRYDYSKVKYKNHGTKVIINCPIHGDFEQTPNTHLKGSGCPMCFGTEKKTTEQFIKEAKVIHGERYDYSKTKYVTKRTKLCITCKKHGDFLVLPHNHLMDENHGNCPKCQIEYKRSTTNEFVRKAKEVHGDKYDYSKVEYKKSQEKVCIICPEHGEFWQTPSSHLDGKGCPKCFNERRGQSLKLSREDFIARAREVHGDKYDYSKVNYVNSATKVCITCNEHGEFWQLPSSHLIGQGCPVCGGHILKTTEQFIEDAKKVHGDKYDYSKVEYVNSKKPIHITCPKHGDFWQTPNMHLRGEECVACAFEKNPIGLASNTEEFVMKARKVHGNKYDYSETIYEHSLKDLKIICPEHGEFWQKPSNHLAGTGCPKCNESRLERMVRVELEKIGLKYVYGKTHKWLGKQTLDFYIPSLNVGIECQGIQHYLPIDYFGGNERFEKMKEMDERKKQLCVENNVPLYYFTYEEYKKYQPEAYTNAKLLIVEIFNIDK